MTLRKLSQLYYLNKLIERDRQKLAELRAKVGNPGTPNYDGMPHNPSPKNMLEETVVLITELEKSIEKEQNDFLRQRMEIEEYIRSVDDYQIRLILSYRFVDLMTWCQVALCIGGNNTEDSVKKMCYRFLKKSEKKESCPKCPDCM